MKFVMRDPCKECPFKVNSLPGWLGPYNADQVFRVVHQDGDFGCHMDIEKVKQLGDSDDNIEHCVGALLHAKATCKQFRNPIKEALKNALISKVPVLGFDFLVHHTLKKLRRGKRGSI